MRVKLPQGTKAVEVAVGGIGACARDEGGQLYCWGNRITMGLSEDVESDVEGGSYFHTPRPVPGLSDALNVWAGNGYACARRRNGEVLCWGSNSGGNLGNGDKIDQVRPTPVRNLF